MKKKHARWKLINRKPLQKTMPVSAPSTWGTVNVAHRLFQYVHFAPIRWHMVAYVIIILIAYPLQKLVAPYLISAGIVRWSKGQGLAALGVACMSLGAVIALSWLLWATLYYINLSMQQRISVDVRRRMVQEVVQQAKVQTKEHSLGRWLTHLENVPQIMEQVVYKFFNYLIPEFTGILVMVVFFTCVDWRLGLATVGYLVITAMYFITFIGGSQVRAKADYDHQTRYNQQMHNTLDNLSYIQSSQSEPFELDKLARESRRFLTTKTLFCHRNSAFILGSNVLLILYALLMLGLIYGRMSTPNVSSHSLALYGTVLVILYAQLSDLDYAKYLMTEIYNYTYKSGVFLEEQPRVTPSMTPGKTSQRRPLAPNSKDPALEMTSLAFTHAPHTRPVFTNVTLRLESYMVYAIRGPSGCGKTTFGKLVAGLYPTPLRGTIRLYGRDVTLDPLARQAAIVYVPQRVKLFEGTVLDNIRYTCTHLSEKDIHRTLHAFDVATVLKRHPRDDRYLQRTVGAQGSELSGGQKQVVLLMRTYLETKKPQRGSNKRTPKSVLILDEPTASLDPEMVETVMTLLAKLKQTHTVLVITHDDKVAELCDHTVTLCTDS